MERPGGEGGLAPDGERIKNIFGVDIHDVPGMDMADHFMRLAVENADGVANLFDDPDSTINPSVHGFCQAPGFETHSTFAALREVSARAKLQTAIIDDRDADSETGLEFKVRGHEYAATASSLSGANLGHVMPVCADG